MSLKLITLNVEGDKHFDTAMPFLQAEQADVVCLQEVFQADLPQWETALNMPAVYAPVGNYTAPNRYGIAPRGHWGPALFSRWPLTLQRVHYYVKQGEKTPEFIDGEPNSVDRALIVGRVAKTEQEYVIATTHFTWSSQGLPTDEQRRDVVNLKALLNNLPEFILCGDFNAPRGGEIYHQLSKGLIDHLPPEVTSTIDPELHYAGRLEIVVDSILSTPEYVSHNTRVVSGISDHQAIVSEFVRKVEFSTGEREGL